MKISVVVPAFNEEKLIAATLKSIQSACASFTEVAWEYEIIVCDNNSTDRTAAVAQSLGARTVFEPVNQISRARNTGAAAATGQWLVFVDADSRPTAQLFAETARCIQSGKYLAGGCTVRMDERHFIADLSTSGWNVVSRIWKWFAGSFSFCETEAFREVKGFSEEFYASEEIDLSKRLKKLARRRGKQMIILHRHPLLTSARKIRLYSPAELLSFFRRATFSPRHTVRHREACSPWYDGRR